MSILTGRIFAGHLRSIIGSMTVEEIVTERQKLATEVLETSKTEMAKIGLTVDSLQIQSIDDGGTGYIEAMAAPHKAAIQRQAQIAQAQATQASVEAQQVAARNQAEYARQTAVVQAEYNAEVDRAQAAGRPGRPAGPGARPAGGARGADRAGPARRRAAPAAAGRRGRQAGRGGGRADPGAGRGRGRADADPGRGRRLPRPGGAGPDAHRPAAADRQGGRGAAWPAPTSTCSTAPTASARSPPAWSARA